VIVELIYDPDCPNVPDARSQLIRAFTQTGISARWREWERGSPDTPGYARAFGSPTILVDGKDIAGVVPNAETRACRVYGDERGNLSGAPSVGAICAALRDSSPAKPVISRWRAMAASFPAIGTALLPKLTCPLCFPAYAAILSAVGIEFVNYTPYLLPLTAIFLTVSIAVLALQARRTGNIVPLILGIAASFIVLFAKFALEADWMTTGGIIVLVIAIFLGSRMKSAANAPCPACAVGEAEQHVKAH
jgi:mercuric ion transport protein